MGNNNDEQVALYVAPQKRALVAIGIFCTIMMGNMAMGALNTIIPVAAVEIGGLELYSLAFIVGTFGGVIGSPLAGGLGDKMNRRLLFIICGLGAIISSVAHILAPTMAILVVIRLLNALFCSFATVTGLSFIGMIFPPEGRVRWMGYYGTMSALGGLIGPLVGGFLADSVGWRYYFVFAAVLSAIGLAIVWTQLPKAENQAVGNTKIDSPGIAAFVVMLVALLYFLNFGGNSFAWISGMSFVLIAVIVICLILFIRIEKNKGTTAFMPMTLFGNKGFTLPFLGQFLGCACKTPFYMYLSMYMQQVLGYSASVAATASSVLAVSSLLFSLVFAQIAAKSGKVKMFTFTAILDIVLVSVISVLGGMFSYFSLPLIYILCILYGIGSTVLNTAFLMMVQINLPAESIGIASGNIQLAMSIGSMIPSSVCSLIINACGDDLNMGIIISWGVGLVCCIFAAIVVAMIKMKKKE